MQKSQDQFYEAEFMRNKDNAKINLVPVKHIRDEVFFFLTLLAILFS